MIVEVGHFALILALAVAVFQFAVPLFGAATGDSRLMRMAMTAALAQLLLVGLAFAVLMHAYLV